MNYDQLESSTATIPGPTGTRDQRYIPLGDRTKVH